MWQVLNTLSASQPKSRQQATSHQPPALAKMMTIMMMMALIITAKHACEQAKDIYLLPAQKCISTGGKMLRNISHCWVGFLRMLEVKDAKLASQSRFYLFLNQTSYVKR